MSFSALGLHPTLVANAESRGYKDPTPIQAETIPLVLAGRDVMGGAQTGTGKTAAFAMPIIHKILNRIKRKPEVEGPNLSALILTPTRELAQQVAASFEAYANNSDIKIATVYGGGSTHLQIKALKQGAHIVVATPGRLLDLNRQDVVDFSRLSMLVFDEADRMLDMGFKDEINQILDLIPKQRQTLLFSATFDDAIFKLSKKLLTDPKLVEVNKRNTSAETVKQLVYSVDADRKAALTAYLIGSKNWQQVLIFTRKKQTADELCAELKKDGIKASSIHGDKSQGARNKALEGFKEGLVRALVATDVAARGLDIQALPVVINYELPFIAEDYVHRIGRTGRAGSEGLAISLMSHDEAWLLEEVEAVLNTHLPQQWYPGFEPDLTKENPKDPKNKPSAQRRRAKQRALGKKTGNRRRRQR